LIPEKQRDWHIEGYLDSVGKGKIRDYPSNYEIVGEENTFSFAKDDRVIIAIAEPAVKEKIYYKMKNKVVLFTYIAPNTIIGKFNQIGEGSIICPNCIITTNVRIGACVTLNIGTQIGHDTRIGDFSSFMPNVDVGGKCEVGDRVYMGTNSTIVPGKKIADDVKISAGSIVIRNIKSKAVVFGNPALKLKD
jgi:sugar O-acyltransferase (sialic acid O-acetyltransferase NeuD family)